MEPGFPQGTTPIIRYINVLKSQAREEERKATQKGQELGLAYQAGYKLKGRLLQINMPFIDPSVLELLIRISSQRFA